MTACLLEKRASRLGTEERELASGIAIARIQGKNAQPRPKQRVTQYHGLPPFITERKDRATLALNPPQPRWDCKTDRFHWRAVIEAGE